MDYNTLLDLATDLGYELAMSGAETFRIEESITRVLSSYGVQAEAFAIPNYLVVSIITDSGKPITRMRRIGQHGNDLDSVEKFNGLSRALCNRKPEPKIGLEWLKMVKSQKIFYSRPAIYLGNFLGALGFALFFGGNWTDGICAGICGLLVGFITQFLEDMKANHFFRTIAAAFAMSLLAYIMSVIGIAPNVDAVVIGALMLLVPGLLFTNAMRDIIYGDTNSGVNRIVQVFLIAVAIALGTAAAWSSISMIFGAPTSVPAIDHIIPMQLIACYIGCLGFVILFNIHGPGGLLCALGGALAWAVYLIALELTGSEISGYFWSALFSSVYSEIMARIRKYPATSYLVVSLFPLLPGAGIYYTMGYALEGSFTQALHKGLETAAIAGVMAVGILLVSTAVRSLRIWWSQRRKRA